jgi:hypothetical protein
MLIFVIEINTKAMKNYNKSEIFTRAHYLFRTCKSLYKTFGEALSDVWQSAIKKLKESKKRALELKNYKEFNKPTVAIQPDLSEYYSNKPANYNFGD